MVLFSSLGSTLTIAFGDKNVKVAVDVASKTTGEYLAPLYSAGLEVGAGQAISFPVPKNCTHFSYVSSDTTGNWRAVKNSGSPMLSSPLPLALDPAVHFDAALGDTVRVTSGAVTVEEWKPRTVSSHMAGASFIAGANKPDLFDATQVSSDLTTPAISFVAGSSESLVCSNTTLAEALSGGNPFSVFLAVRRTAATADHTLLSVGTAGSDNGRWDITLDSSDDFVFTVVDTGGTSATYSVAATYGAAIGLYTLTFAGDAAPTFWKDRVLTSLTAGGTLGSTGTATKVTIGARSYNTSTIGQYASAQIAEIIIADRVWSAAEVGLLHERAAHRYAV